jgi:hypothetical protein
MRVEFAVSAVTQHHSPSGDVVRRLKLSRGYARGCLRQFTERMPDELKQSAHFRTALGEQILGGMPAGCDALTDAFVGLLLVSIWLHRLGFMTQWSGSTPPKIGVGRTYRIPSMGTNAMQPIDPAIAPAWHHPWSR